MLVNKSFPIFIKGLTRSTFGISTELIKKQYQQQLQKKNKDMFLQYPKTFEQKQIVLNHPKTVQIIQIIQFGVKYKNAKNWLPLLLVALALAGYIQQKILPIRINDRFFMISGESLQYPTGFLTAAFNFQKPFYLYLPAMLGVHQLSRFIGLRHFGMIIAANMFVGNLLGWKIMSDRLSKYQVWKNERMCFGQGNLLSIIYAFWSYIGFKDAFTHLKSKIFLKAVPGIGIIRKGLPFGYICIFYGALEMFFWRNGARNSQVILAQILTGLAMGLVLRKVKPLIR